jgi:hypothetical protein
MLTQSCSSTMPTSFWKNFESSSLTNEISDQGPFGGHRALFWKVKTPDIFNSAKILEFASKNVWKLKDSSNFTLTTIQNWKHNGKTIFSLSNKGFTPNENYSNTEFDNFPLTITSDLKVFIFETNWTKVDPGTTETTNAFGYVVLNNDKTEMAVYHLWGE